MKLDSNTEKQIKSEVVKLLQKGKPDWDIPHTLDAVKWIKILIKEEDGDERILVPTMYFHDTGYPLLKEGYNFEELIRSKEKHEERSANNAKEILPKLSFSEEEIDEISSLILYHDELDKITTKNQQLVFEADSLAQVNWNEVKPNFDKENCMKFMDAFKKNRMPLFKTKTGKRILSVLLEQTERYWD